jgi:predicted membrane protein
VRTLPEDLIPERSGAVSWWSDVKRNGDWIVPRAFRAFTCMGHVELDLTYARMGSGTTEMELNCFMGAIDVIVPADVRVLCDGDSIVGSFNVDRIGNTTPPADAPTLKVSGTAYFGAVTIKIVDPNAPGWAEKLKAGWASLKG